MDMLEIVYQDYPVRLLNSWMAGKDYSMISSSNCSKYFHDILVFKASRRKKKPNTWFFGEAYIASITNMSDGWYNSFKWLTAAKWITGKGLKVKYEKPFYIELMTHIGPILIKDLQQKAKVLFNNRKERFFDPKDGKYHRPVTPDLWLIDKDGSLRFIESKLQTEGYADTAKSHQLAGLAIIKKYLITSNPVSVSIMYLYPKGGKPIKDDTVLDSFQEFYEIA
jgi:hypothetical protein